jgi:hypothetical protein
VDPLSLLWLFFILASLQPAFMRAAAQLPPAVGGARPQNGSTAGRTGRAGAPPGARQSAGPRTSRTGHWA